MSAAPKPMSGVLSPVVTPFAADLSVDMPRMVAHCRCLLDADVGLAVFGTNSEGNSMTIGERTAVLQALTEAGLPADRMMPGTGGCAIPDVVDLTRTAVRMGCGGVLVLPPFYYKGVSDDGLFAFYSEVIERVADERLRLYLYHIPPVAQVPLSLDLVGRLLDRYGSIVAGIKDSGGQWDNTASLIERYASRGLQVFAGSETFLLRTMRAGGAGCISATANVNPAAIVDLHGCWRGADADQKQAALDRIRTMFAAFPMIPAMKHALALATGHEGWRRLRPPLLALPQEQQSAFAQVAQKVGFALTLNAI
ncbi:MAG: dihydrodipicolinate synthase family protein [Rhodoferax sp.]|nr:dihydrodipicolinate synthase family protein [Rhodoferax sp.]